MLNRNLMIVQGVLVVMPEITIRAMRNSANERTAFTSSLRLDKFGVGWQIDAV